MTIPNYVLDEIHLHLIENILGQIQIMSQPKILCI